jgi:histidyl-tRNA synthetase
VSNRGIGAQLKYADRRGIPFALIPGTEELANGQVSLKNLSTGEQLSVDRSGLVSKLKEVLADAKGE